LEELRIGESGLLVYMTCILELVSYYVTVTDARFRHAWERNHKLCCQPRIMRGTPAGTSEDKKKLRATRFIRTADGSIMTKWHHSFCPDLIAETYNKVL